MPLSQQGIYDVHSPGEYFKDITGDYWIKPDASQFPALTNHLVNVVNGTIMPMSDVPKFRGYLPTEIPWT